ncbi:MAG TPA: hypothetical protein DDW52_18445 [Planctomycetaceae bacterium]|nr:hypothetical protein [Planctomycetaceae bacterium]
MNSCHYSVIVPLRVRNETLRISVIGAIVGAIGCAIGRSLVVYSAIQKPALILMLPSAGIGMLVGAISGAIGRPLISAVTGALLSAFVFELFLLPCASLIGTLGEISGNANADSDFIRSTLKYLIGMAVAGGVGGGIGGAMGRHFGDLQIESDDANLTSEPNDEFKSHDRPS